MMHMTIGKAHMTKDYERWRVKSPSAFIPGSFRTHDFGRAGYSKRIAGRLRGTGKWATQSILISHREPAHVKAMLRASAKRLIHGKRRMALEKRFRKERVGGIL